MQVSSFVLIKKYPVKVFVCVFSCEHVGIPVFKKEKTYLYRKFRDTCSVCGCLSDCVNITALFFVRCEKFGVEFKLWQLPTHTACSSWETHYHLTLKQFHLVAQPRLRCKISNRTKLNDLYEPFILKIKHQFQTSRSMNQNPPSQVAF